MPLRNCINTFLWVLSNLSISIFTPKDDFMLVFGLSDIIANREEGGQSNSQTQKDPIHKAVGAYFIF